MKKYFYALAIFAGTTIGVGLFGLPFVTAQIGFVPIIIYFFVLGLLMLVMQLIFGEIILRTTGHHRMPGYAKIYLGGKAKIIALISNSIGFYGALLAYIIIGGGFLASLLKPMFGGTDLTYRLLFFAAGAVLIYLGSRTIAKSELISLAIFLGVLIFLIIKGIPHIQIENFYTFEPSNIFLPYGVILFSIAGISLIPEAREILAEKSKQLKSVIIVGSLIPILTYVAFIILVFGVNGPATTQDALTGLESVLGQQILIAGFIFGIITTFTSFLTIGLTLKKIFWYDFKFTHFNAWIVASFVPLVLYFAGIQNFIAIIAFTGAVTLGVDSIMTFLIYLKARKKGQRIPEYKIKIPRWAIYLLMFVFVAGAALTIISL